MKRVGGDLHIDYTVTNRLDRRVWVYSHLWKHPPERIVVHDAAEKHTVAFTHGFVDHGTGAKFGEPPPAPHMRRLEANGNIRGFARVPIPLRAWLNYYIIKPLELGATHGVLEVAFCDGPDERCVEATGGDETPMARVPMLLRGARLPLPDGAMSWIPQPPSVGWQEYQDFLDRAHRDLQRRMRERGEE